MINRIKLWWRQLTCNHPDWARMGRLRLIEEVGDFYEECLKCHKEFYE